MFILADNNPVRHIRSGYVNRALIVACIAVFLLELAGVAPPEHFALVPAQLVRGWPLPPEFGDLPGPVRLVSHIFLHGSWLHLLGNLIPLWVFGDNVEDSMGHGRYLGFFLLCGIAGGLAETAMTADPTIAVIGASGAISGVMGAYQLLHPRAKVLVLLLFRLPVLVPASFVVGLDIAVNLVMGFGWAGTPGPDAPLIAWWAHLGGFAGGMVLIAVMRRADVPLFQPASVYPAMPYPRLRWLLIDVMPHPPAGAPPPSHGERAMAVAKAGLFLTLLAVLASLF